MSVDLYDPSAPTATSDVDLVSAVTIAGDNNGCTINAVDTHIESSCTPDVTVGGATTLVSTSDPVTTNHPVSLEVSSRDSDPLHDGSNNNCSILSQCSHGLLEHSVLMVSEEPMASNAMLAMRVDIAAASSHPFLPSQSSPVVVLNIEGSDEANAQCLQQDARPATPHNGQLNVQSASADEGQTNNPTSKNESSHVQSNSRSRQGSGSPLEGREENEKPNRHTDEYGRKSRERSVAHRKPYVREEKRALDHERRGHAGNEEKRPDYENKKRVDREDRRPSDRDDRKRTDIQDKRHADYGNRRHADYEDKKLADHDNRKHADHEERGRASQDDRRKAEREGQRHRDLPDRRQSTQDNHRRFGHDDRRSPRYNNGRPCDRDSYRYQGRSDGRRRAETPDVEDKLTGTSKHAGEKSSKTVRRGRSRSRSITPGQQPKPSTQRRSGDSRTEMPPVRRPTNSDMHARLSPVYDTIVTRKSSSPVKIGRQSHDSPGAKLTSRQTSVDTTGAALRSSGTKPQSISLDQAGVSSNQAGESDALSGEARSLRRLDTGRSSSPQTTQTMQLPSHSEPVSMADKRDSVSNGGSISELRILGGRPQPSASPAQQGFQAVRPAEGSRSRSAADTVSSLSFTELMRLPPPPLPPPTLIMPLSSSGPPMMSGIPPARMPPMAPSALPHSLSLQFPPVHHALLAHHGMPPPPLGLLPPVSLGLLPPPLSLQQPPHGVRPPHGFQPFVPASTSSPGLFFSPPPLGLQSYMPHQTGHLPFTQPPPFVSPPTGHSKTEQPPPPPPPASQRVHGIDRLVGIHGGSAGAHFQRHPEPGFVTSASPPPPPDFFMGSEKTDEALKARSNLIVIQPSDAESQTHKGPFRMDPHDKYSSSDDMTEAPMDMAADDDSDDEQDDDMSCGTPGGGNAAKDMVNGADSLHKCVPPSDGVNTIFATVEREAATTVSEEHRSHVVHVGQGDAEAPLHGSADAAQPPQRAIEVLQQLQQLLSRGGTSQQSHEPQAKSEMHTGVLGAVLSGKASSNDVADGALLKTKKARSRAESLKVKESPGSDIPSSATELSNLKAIEKMNRQERIAEEVKVVLKPYYRSGKISKAEYKEIMKKAVHKIYNSKSAEINPVKVKIFVDGYVAKTIQVHKLQRRRQQVQS